MRSGEKLDDWAGRKSQSHSFFTALLNPSPNCTELMGMKPSTEWTHGKNIYISWWPSRRDNHCMKDRHRRIHLIPHEVAAGKEKSRAKVNRAPFKLRGPRNPKRDRDGGDEELVMGTCWMGSRMTRIRDRGRNRELGDTCEKQIRTLGWERSSFRTWRMLRLQRADSRQELGKLTLKLLQRITR